MELSKEIEKVIELNRSDKYSEINYMKETDKKSNWNTGLKV